MVGHWRVSDLTDRDRHRMVASLNSRIDTLDTKFERKFDQMDRKFEQKFDQMDQKFERKFDQINTLLLSLSHDIGELKGACPQPCSTRRPDAPPLSCSVHRPPGS